MFRQRYYVWIVAASILAIAGFVYTVKAARSRSDQEALRRRPNAAQVANGETDVKEPPITTPLYTPTSSEAPPSRTAVHDDIIIHDCRLVDFVKREVPSQRDGVILFIGTEIVGNDPVPSGWDVVQDTFDGKTIRYHPLHEGDVVKKNQMLARLDDRLGRREWESKNGKVTAAQADLQASVAARNEARSRYETGLQLYARDKKAIAKEELNERKLVWDKLHFESISKEQAVELAKLEARQAQTVLEMHEIRSPIDGIIKTVYRKSGEAVKSAPSYEAVFQVMNLGQLRVEGLVDEQNLPSLRTGDMVDIETSVSQGPKMRLVGHMQEVTGVAVSKDSKLIVTSSLESKVRVWSPTSSRELRSLDHPGAVTAVACTPEKATENLCLSGSADGTARIWNLDDPKAKARLLNGTHRGGINCVAFSPDGAYCATGGDDRKINVWNTASGERLYVLHGHSGAVTSITFTPQDRLISAGRDNTLRIWELGTEHGRLMKTIDRRSGDVAHLGVNPQNGEEVLFDPWQSKGMRILSIPGGETEGVLEEPSSASHFATFALFSPKGDAIVTAGGDGRLQLWQPPTATTRAYIKRYHVSSQRLAPTCAAFAPDGSFLVVGTENRQVLLWTKNYSEELAQPPKARITNIERSLDSHQVRIWAELSNTDGKLIPGATVTMVAKQK